MKLKNKYNLAQYKSKHKKLDEDDEMVQADENQLGYFVQQKTLSHYTVPIDTSFANPNYYRTVVQMLMTADEDDQVAFMINSPGGLLSGLLTLLEGLNMTSATTSAIIVGEASSAASMFALSCDNVFVSDNCTMLCHNISYGTNGKGSDVLSHVEHISKTASKLLRKTYEGFLSEKEIDEVLAGKELYLDADEIVERLENREVYREAKQKAEEEAEKQFVEAAEAKPKRQRAKKT